MYAVLRACHSKFFVSGTQLKGSQQKAMAKAKAKPAPTQKGAPAATTTAKAAQPQKDSVILPAGHQQAADQQAVSSLRAELTEAFRQALEKAFPQAKAAPVVTQTNEAKFGDYQCNNAMALFGQLKGQVSSVKPRITSIALSLHASANVWFLVSHAAFDTHSHRLPTTDETCRRHCSDSTLFSTTQVELCTDAMPDVSTILQAIAAAMVTSSFLLRPGHSSLCTCHRLMLPKTPEQWQKQSWHACPQQTM